jgi:predicted O-methyltransferase YrrM
MLHPLVETVLTTGTIPAPEGRSVKAHSHIPRAECELLYRAAAAARPRVAVEVGMAFGLSTLCLCDALKKANAGAAEPPRLIVMDPAQHDATWQGLGLHLVERAGFGALVEFHERTSQQVLPELVARGCRAQLAFIDGYHTFDHTLVDFFYVDQLLEPGGVVVFDDLDYPSVHAAARFVLSNRDYEILELAAGAAPAPAGAKHAVKRLLRRLGRTDRHPDDRHERLFDRLRGAKAVALRKRGEDSRRWDHYVPF